MAKTKAKAKGSPKLPAVHSAVKRKAKAKQKKQTQPAAQKKGQASPATGGRQPSAAAPAGATASPQQRKKGTSAKKKAAPAKKKAMPASKKGTPAKSKSPAKRKRPQQLPATAAEGQAAVPPPTQQQPRKKVAVKRKPAKREQQAVQQQQQQHAPAQAAAAQPGTGRSEGEEGAAAEGPQAKRRKVQGQAAPLKHLESGRTLFVFDTNAILGHRSATAEAWTAILSGEGQQVQALVPQKVLQEVKSRAGHKKGPHPGAAASTALRDAHKGGAQSALDLLREMMRNHSCCRVQREDETFRRHPKPLTEQKGDDCILDCLLYFSSLGAQVVLVTHDRGFAERADDHGLCWIAAEAAPAAVRQALAGGAITAGVSGAGSSRALEAHAGQQQEQQQGRRERRDSVPGSSAGPSAAGAAAGEGGWGPAAFFWECQQPAAGATMPRAALAVQAAQGRGQCVAAPPAVQQPASQQQQQQAAGLGKAVGKKNDKKKAREQAQQELIQRMERQLGRLEWAAKLVRLIEDGKHRKKVTGARKRPYVRVGRHLSLTVEQVGLAYRAAKQHQAGGRQAQQPAQQQRRMPARQARKGQTPLSAKQRWTAAQKKQLRGQQAAAAQQQAAQQQQQQQAAAAQQEQQHLEGRRYNLRPRK